MACIFHGVMVLMMVEVSLAALICWGYLQIGDIGHYKCNDACSVKNMAFLRTVSKRFSEPFYICLTKVQKFAIFILCHVFFCMLTVE